MIPSPATADYALLNISEIKIDTTCYRISNPNFSSPLYFNTGQDSRWASPAGEYGVCYVADSVEAAFAETFGRNAMGSHPAGQPKIISEASLAARNLYAIQNNTNLSLGDLYGDGLANLTLDNSINTTTDYTQVHFWSKWVQQHPENLHGLRFQSRHLSDRLCSALFDISESTLKYEDHGPMIDWVCRHTDKTIDDILKQQDWVIV